MSEMTHETLRALTFVIANGDIRDDVAAHADAWETLEGSLLAMTPGGSEFVGSPRRCLEFIKDRMATVMKVAIANKALEAEVAELRAELRDALEVSIARGERLGHLSADDDYRARIAQLPPAPETPA
jgi:hypothetical protein